mgnify:CR=1 FL=1
MASSPADAAEGLSGGGLDLSSVMTIEGVDVRGKRVLVLHPQRLTPVAEICYEHGITMIQIL